MKWVSGEALNSYIQKSLFNSSEIELISEKFLDLVNTLENNRVAHGNLTHSKIIIQNGNLYLIDYDSLYIPELINQQAKEVGHINFQHPKRNLSHFNERIDRFPSIIIYTALKAIALKRSLWSKYDNGNNLLFTYRDYLDPKSSPLISELLKIPELQPLVENITEICLKDFDEVPSLKEFVALNKRNKIMLLPRGDEYNVAVQNPKIAFTDLDLKNSQVEITPLGLPKPYSGGFTTTYKLSNHQKGWAVRCFQSEIQDLQRRYQAFGNFLSNNKSDYFVDAKYLSEGIKVNGKAYPVIKMLWLEGEPLNVCLSKVYNQNAKIEKLLADFTNLINELEKVGIAHGDLQHGNIIVRNDKIYLIDYDGMYFPELASLRTNEIGHVNYQHPKRVAFHYNQYIDRFSAIIIYVGLKAISLNPDLWKKYDNGENILFKSQDFADLQHSSLIKDLAKMPELKTLVERLVGCCYLEFEKIPSLKEFLAGSFSYNKNAAGTIAITRSQYKIIDATKKESLLEHFGEKIEVVGKISKKRSGSTIFRTPFMFLNFGLYPHQTFTLVIWAEGISALTAKGLSPGSLVGKWVSVTGVITSYENKPQMTIELPSQIQILNSETEASQKLTFKPTPATLKKTVTTAQPAKKVVDKEADIFNDLYKHKPVYTPPKPVASTATPKPVTNSNTYKPPSYTSTTNKTAKTTSGRSANRGCAMPIFFALIGISIASIASEGKMWFVGAIIGGFIGVWISNE
jgi:tRNA A-37 threonylcarbamoyl transferase component Bud32